MQATMRAVKTASLARGLNAWKLKIGLKAYAITPAHVAMHPKNGIWCISKFLDGFGDLPWHISTDWVETQHFRNDLAWCELPPDHEQGALVLSSDLLCDLPFGVDIAFHQPYTPDAQWTSDASFATLHTTAYPSPGKDGRWVQRVKRWFGRSV
eukprot:TRINITY_DN66668_c4_g3_i4.p2 TRINITY_DN66668_c4_g3~~TRINITY_DN66668_c4_g3_i4.p2  ORF type:complete len:153 (+),score=3.01 TRINITY_DN66668_c4_g3_i4:198-656(+)